MTTHPTWTPAARPGIIPLQPLGFGTILGRSFSALRQNPKVLLGFALTITALVSLISLGGIIALAIFTIGRAVSLSPSDEDYDTIMAGSVALLAVGSIVLTILAGAVGVVVQGVVVSEVTHAVVAEKLTLRRLWRRVRPVIWRLIGYTLLLAAAIGIAAVILIVGIVVLETATGAWVVIPVVLLLIAAVPLSVWLTTKLLLVPAVIVVEHAPVFTAIARSWRLVRGRFWVAFGVWIIIQLVFSAIAQMVSIPVSMGIALFSTTLAPTGEGAAGALVSILISALLTQVVTVLIQAVALVVMATASALIYIDCRMRHEGLDLDLLAYVEARDDGATDLPDPYRQHIGRELSPQGYGSGGHSVPGYGAPVAYPAPTGYGAPVAYPAPTGYAAGAGGYPPGPTGYPPPAGYAAGAVGYPPGPTGHAASPVYPPAAASPVPPIPTAPPPSAEPAPPYPAMPPAPPAPEPPPASAAPRADTEWLPPGAPTGHP